ncbi:CIR protein [Plasmodium chabaudi chabaudi]|uniref:CIR protein n=1 Tax=Plasmodium chabaudi chabaudi TaxID=31271 RepID=A0A1D3L9G7_PLACU|nr:CIR protein [Plasmodium chabaudi chabaudi]
MDKNVCKLFADADDVFNHGTVKENIFNTSNLYKKYCPNGNCNTNYDRISALCEYLLAELPKLNNNPKGSEDNVNQNYEYVFMWLADKFIKISPGRSFSLNDYYEKVIVNHGGNFNCWGKLDNKEHLKDSNISIMALFYQAFMNICNPIMKNEISNFELKKFMNFDNSCYQVYDLINFQVSNCDPYVQLLINLKKSYDEYRNLAIEKIPKEDLKNILTFLPIMNNDDQKGLQFQSQGCIELHAMFEQSYKKPKPRRRQRMPKHPPNDAKIQKEKVKINKGESNKPTNSAEKHNEPQKEIQPSKPKAPASPQKSDTQPQIFPKSSQNLQETPPNNNHVSSNVTGAPTDMENVSVNQVNNQEIAKTRSRRGLALQQNHHTSNHSESLSQLSETTVENTPVESSDKLEDTRSEPAKRIKRNVPQDKPPNQEGNPEKKTPDSLSLENPESESSNIVNVIDYSVNFFKTYSSLFNDTINTIENHIHDIIISKINDIIDKIVKYQQIIQAIKFSKDPIQEANDHQKEPENSQKKKAEQPPSQKENVEQPPSTKTTEETPVNSDGILSKLVSEPGNNVMELNGNITKLLSSKFGGYKVAIMALMAVSIPIVLAIMYKYLYYGCGKTSKKKKMVKKIINSQNGKRKINDIIDKIVKYQQIIQAIKFSKDPIQEANDHQKEPENSQKKKAEQPPSQKENVEQPPSTKTTEETPVNSDGILSKLVSEPGNNVMELNGNITKLLSSKFGGYKVAIMALMAVSIPIVLAIMYKYLYYGCGKTSKKKKMVKKIINSQNGKRKVKKIINPIDGKNTSNTIISPINVKRTLKTVINPIDGKNTSNTIISSINVKRTLKTIMNSIDEENTENATISPNREETNVKTTIDSDCEEKTTIVIINSYDEKDVTIQNVKSSSPKTTSLNGYKHIFANPAPFINLFFLLIFFVYKRKYNFL